MPVLLDRRTRRAIEARLRQTGTDALAAAVQSGELDAFAERAAMAELARRVLADEVDFGPAARGWMARLLDRASKIAYAVAIAVWLAWLLGFIG